VTFPAARQFLPPVDPDDLTGHQFLATPMGAASPPVAIDYSTSRPTRAALQQVSAVAVGRYVSYPGGVNKDITRAEADQLRSWGLGIFVYWENAAADALGGRADGQNMAAAARNMVRDAGGPADGGLIYFCVDFNVTPAQMPTVLDWFRGIRSVLPVSQVGVYGGYYPVAAVLDAGLADQACQTRAWSGGLWDGRAALQQYSWTTLADGSQVDLLRIMQPDYGQWGAEADMPLTDADVQKIIAGFAATRAGVGDQYAGALDHFWDRGAQKLIQQGLARTSDVQAAVAPLLDDEAKLTTVVQDALASVPGGSAADVATVTAAVRAVLSDVRLSAPEPPA